jgi:aryl-alcohol dehydrogenase-like predicted oxidoreductase
MDAAVDAGIIFVDTADVGGCSAAATATIDVQQQRLL